MQNGKVEAVLLGEFFPKISLLLMLVPSFDGEVLQNGLMFGTRLLGCMRNVTVARTPHVADARKTQRRQPASPAHIRALSVYPTTLYSPDF